MTATQTLPTKLRELRLSNRFLTRWSENLTPGGPDDCWEWGGRRDDKGYGFVKVFGYTTRVHRVAWAQANGGWPPASQVVRHTCDNPPCCNPAHLVLGTVRDNVADCIDRDRRAKGESLRQSRLTEADVLTIRKRAASGESARSIATTYGLTRQAISHVITRKNWRHVL